MTSPNFDVSIVYYGDQRSDTTSGQRLAALRRLARSVEAVPSALGLMDRLGLHAYWRLGLRVPTTGSSGRRTLAGRVRASRPDILWLDKPLDVGPRVIQRLRAAHPALVVVGYSPDDMGQRHNRSATFDALLPRLDLFFTTKSFGVAELTAAGCPHVRFIGNAYDPDIHAPIGLDAVEREAWGSEVSFVGTYEAARAKSLMAVAAAGLQVRVWGNDWERVASSPNLRIERREAKGCDFARVAGASRINLGFLRKLNRDRQTTRSVEIPACGGFMLAERTDEHLGLFEEGREAEFFADDAELIAKCRRYLADEPARARIAAAGRARCLASGYSNDDRMAEALTVLQPMIEARRAR